MAVAIVSRLTKLALKGVLLLFLLIMLGLAPILIVIKLINPLRIRNKSCKIYRDLLSGDKPLSIKERFTYLVYNFISGISGYSCMISSKYWHTDKFTRVAREEGRSFPTRIYLNQFLIQELPKMIGIGNIDILDVGCGSGYVRKLLNDVGYTGSYTGVDIYKDIDFDKYTLNFKSNLIESKIEDFETDKKFDVVLSITSLEHIKNDVLTVYKCDDLSKLGGIQIYIIPTFWHLFTTPWHGYRQYNPKRIKSLFHGKKYKIYRLGGVFSFFLILLFISIPNFLFFRTLRYYPFYQKLIRKGNRLDKSLPFCSHLYIVVVRK